MTEREHLAASLERTANLLRRRDQVARQLDALQYELVGLEKLLKQAEVDRLADMYPQPEPEPEPTEES